MIKLFVLKQQREDGEATGNQYASHKPASAAQQRIIRPISELNLPKTCQMEFFNSDDLLNFNVIICPSESFYLNGRLMVSFRPSPNYPHEPPRAKCHTMVYHPDRDLDGNLLNSLKTCQIEFPAADDLLKFELVFCPDESIYRNGRFVFNFRKSANYPHEPPKVKYDTNFHHPNADLDGDVCLNISGEDWKPLLTVNYTV